MHNTLNLKVKELQQQETPMGFLLWQENDCCNQSQEGTKQILRSDFTLCIFYALFIVSVSYVPYNYSILE